MSNPEVGGAWVLWKEKKKKKLAASLPVLQALVLSLADQHGPTGGFPP